MFFKQILNRLQQPEPAPPWGLFTVIGAAIAAFAAMVAATSIVSILIGQPPSVTLVGWTLGGLAIVIFVNLTQGGEDARAALYGKESALPLLFVLLFGIAAGILVDVIALVVTGEFLPVPELLRPVYSDGLNLLAWVFAFVFMLAVQPIAEELVFRGIAYPAVRDALGNWLAIVVCALLYGGFHSLTYAPSPATFPAEQFTAVWYALISPILAGLLLTAMRAYTGSTRAAIAMHAGIGVFEIVKALLLVGG